MPPGAPTQPQQSIAPTAQSMANANVTSRQSRHGVQTRETDIGRHNPAVPVRCRAGGPAPAWVMPQAAQQHPRAPQHPKTGTTLRGPCPGWVAKGRGLGELRNAAEIQQHLSAVFWALVKPLRPHPHHGSRRGCLWAGKGRRCRTQKAAGSASPKQPRTLLLFLAAWRLREPPRKERRKKEANVLTEVISR